MKKTVKFLAAAAPFMTFCWIQPANGHPSSFRNADVILEYQSTEIVVQADGTYTLTEERHYTAETEKGREQLTVNRIPYDPRTSTIKVNWAKSLDGGVTSKLSLVHMQDKANGAMRELVLPMSHVRVGSTVEYRYTLKQDHPMIDGIFSGSFLFGEGLPVLASHLKITAPMPLQYKARNQQQFLKIREGHDGDRYTLGVDLREPLFQDRSHDASIQPVIQPSDVIRVDVTTAKTWADVVTPLTDQYENVLTDQLPPLLANIAQKARQQLSQADKLNVATEGLASHLKYVSDDKASSNSIDSLSLKQIVRQKTVDSKDLAICATAIFRRMGYSASVVLVHTTNQADAGLFEPVNDNGYAPSADYFNHAIVRVMMLDGRVRWIDPSSILSYAEGIPPQVAGSLALDLDASTKDLERVPDLSQAPSSRLFEQSIDIHPDHTADVTGDLLIKGADAVLVREKGRVEGITYDSARYELPLPQDAEVKIDLKRHESNYVKTENGMTQITVPLPTTAHAFKVASNRSDGTYLLGVPGVTETVTKLKGLYIDDEINNECLALSPWMGITRSVKKTADGIEIHDRLEIKNAVLDPQALKAEEPTFQDRLDNCFKAETLIISKNAHSTLDEASLGDGVRLLLLNDSSDKLRTYNLLKAKRIFENLVARNADDFKANAYLAETIMELGHEPDGRYDKEYLSLALKYASKATDVATIEILPRLIRAQIYIAQGDFKHACNDFNIAYRKDSDNFEIIELGANLSLAMKSYSVAEAWFSALPDYAQTPHEKGQAATLLAGFYEQTNQWNKAVNAYKASIPLQQNPGADYGHLSTAYRHLGRWDDAISMARKAVQADKQKDAYAGLVAALTAKVNAIYLTPEKQKKGLVSSEFKTAEDLLLEAISIDADNVDAIALAGKLYASRAIKTKKPTDVQIACRYLEMAARLSHDEKQSSQLMELSTHLRKPDVSQMTRLNDAAFN